MAVAQLQKIQIFILQKKSREFLTGLQDLGCFEISNIAEQNEQAEALPLRYQKAVNFLDMLFPRPRGFIENFIQVKPVVKKTLATEILKKQPKEILANLEKAQIRWDELNKQIKQLTEEIARQEIYKIFGLKKAKQIAKLQKVKVIFGIINEKFVNAEIMQTLKVAEIQGAPIAYVQMVCLPEDEAETRDALQGTGFQEIILPLQKEEYAKVSQRLQKDLQKAQTALNKLKNNLAQFNQDNYTRLAVWTDYLLNSSRLDNFAGEIAATEKTSLISGWIPAAQKKQLQKYLSGFAKDLYWREVEPEEGEIPPVVLRNTVTAPLEAVTMLYGLPNQNEFDPSPLMAPFFILFYGLCLSDAGYGLMLVISAAFLLAKFHANLTKFGKKLLTLNIYCGFSTIIVGLLTGSFLGIDFNILPWPAVKNFFLSAKIIDPMANPLPLLGLSVGLGILQMLTGLTIRFILDIRQIGLVQAFLKSGCWVVFLTSIFAWAGLTILGAPQAGILKYIVLGGVAFMILTQGRHQKNPLMKLCSGVLSLYSLSSYVGDILSYTRLFALGLVTAVLAMVINYLAGMTGGVPVVGIVLMALIFVFGHILDFLINLLGSFVHSARLQYVEYFSKFFEGGGRFFKPFSVRTKYVNFE